MTASDKQLLTVKDVATLLAISTKSVYRMVDGRQVRFYRIKAGLRFRREDIESYLQGCLVEVINENEYERQKNIRPLVR